MLAKPTLILIHGWGCNTRVWDDVATGLAHEYEVISPALPGHGSSQISSEQDKDFIVDLARSLRAPAHWLGWSLGALLAMQAALRFPDQVKSLLLVSATPCFRQSVDWRTAMPPADLEAFQDDYRQDSARTLQRFYALQSQGDAHGQSVLRQLKAMSEDQDHDAMGWGLNVLGQTDLRPQLHELSQPVHLLHGMNDRVVPVEAGSFLAEETGGDIDVWQQTGHVPFMSRPEEFLRWIRQAVV